MYPVLYLVPYSRTVLKSFFKAIHIHPALSRMLLFQVTVVFLMQDL